MRRNPVAKDKLRRRRAEAMIATLEILIGQILNSA
jgi:hypothetical protein